jgi:hyperosmotically inducible periplasmic protein
MKRTHIVVLVLAGVIAAPCAYAQTPSTVTPDNAKTNKEVVANSPTADSQTNNAKDLDLTKRIRQSVMADKSLSTYAHNVKIVTRNGSVTLNGVVRSEDERSAIERMAADIAGQDKVSNAMKVAPSNK